MDQYVGSVKLIVFGEHVVVSCTVKTGKGVTVKTTGAVVIHPALSADKMYVPAPTAVASPTKVVPFDSK